jgi:hypothetical protein
MRLALDEGIAGASVLRPLKGTAGRSAAERPAVEPASFWGWAAGDLNTAYNFLSMDFAVV